MNEKHVLKVPKDQSVGMSAELFEHLRDNGRLELYGEIVVPGFGAIGREDVDELEGRLR